MLAPKIVAHTKNLCDFCAFFSKKSHFSAHVDAIVVYFITFLTKHTKCNVLPTHHKCVVCKIINDENTVLFDCCFL